jgi:alpha-D-ribose 1-methylphosphonate 5-triphosphate diphosphatase
MQTLIHNAALVLPGKLVDDGWLVIEDGLIADLGESARCPEPSTMMSRVDAAGCFLIPGLIDLHSDDIERLVEPRPNVHFDLKVALVEADWRLAGCGITTEFHAVTLDDNEFSVRSDSFLRELAQEIGNQSSSLLVRHKIHVRLELSSRRGISVITEMLADRMVAGQTNTNPDGAAMRHGWSREIGILSLMDHSPGQGQYTTEKAYREYMLRTTQKSDAEVDAILALKRSQASKIAERIERISHMARKADLPIATHDDDTIEKVEKWPALGVTLSEFPTTMEAARRAHELGLSVCMGAPNALRGKSSGGNLSALGAIRSGVADILCTDYYPAAMLGAAFKLATQNMLELPHAIRLVTLNPAKAIGLSDTSGSLEPGKIADLILVSLSRWRIPIVQSVFVDGKERIRRSSN